MVKEDNIQWYINNLNKLNTHNGILKSPNFRISNSIWYSKKKNYNKFNLLINN